MIDATTEQRRTAARVALAAYAGEHEDGHGGETLVCGLMGDLLHLAASDGLCVERILRRARRDHQADGGDPRLDEAYHKHLDPAFSGTTRTRIYAGLDWHNAVTLGDVACLSKTELLEAPGLAAATVALLAAALDTLGLELEPK